jgi:hypothetical protein
MTDDGVPELVLARDARLVGDDLRSRAPGTLRRVRRGVYVAAAEWDRARREQRHRIMIEAVAVTRRAPSIFSHVSAAILWGIPIVGSHLNAVHLITGGRTVARTKNGVIWHHEPLDDEDVAEIQGHEVTGFTRTLIDLARTLPFAPAVAVVDNGMRRSTPLAGDSKLCGGSREELLESLELLRGEPGVRGARAAVEFADPRSGSPGESISRANMHLLHFPPPRLQVAFARPDGGKDVTDFDWPEHGAFGEFDGYGKYVKEEFTKGRTIQEIVMLEKERENRIRKHRPFGARWDWTIAMKPSLLRSELLQAGLRPLR